MSEAMDAVLVALVSCATFLCVQGLFCGTFRTRPSLAHVLARRAGELLQAVAESKGPHARKETIVQDMPLFLDIVTLGISAGLSFDSSLDLYCDRYQTPLARSMSKAQLSWRLGVVGRAEALESLSQEYGIAALDRFASTVSEALAFGTPLAGALERQAQVIRDEQRAQIEQEIERTPVKMLIPLATMILPSMLLSILGPLLGPALSVG